MPSAFSLATIRYHGAAVPVIEVKGHYWLLEPLLPQILQAGSQRGLMNLFQDWANSLAQLQELASHIETLADPIATAASSLEFLTPLQYPAKVMATGTNYYDHLRAVGRHDFSKASNYPAFFMKPPTTALVGPGPVRYPTESSQLDWEVELAVIIGKKASHVTAQSALDHVAAYTVGLDLSTRDMQRNQKHFAKMDLCLGKAFDDSCPLGPHLIPAASITDPQNLSMKLWVNDQLEQDSNTSNMIWSVAEQIAEITKHITLEPGDVLLTGTPAGSGIESGRYLKKGDRIDAEIGNFGRLSVAVV